MAQQPSNTDTAATAATVGDLAENQTMNLGVMVMPDAEYKQLARDLYVTVLKLRKAVHCTDSIHEAKTLSLHIMHNTPAIVCATKCFDMSVTSDETTMHCKTNPKVPAGYHLIGRVESKYRMYPEEFHKEAVCSDDGVQWYLVSRIGEPGCGSLVAEPDEVT